MIKKVGFIGLGTMGKPMALNIAQAGYDLIVYDIRDERLREFSEAGAKIARSAKEVAECSDLIAIAVLDDIQIEAALFSEAGVFAGAKPGTIVAIHSTVLPKTLTKLSRGPWRKTPSLSTRRSAAAKPGLTKRNFAIW